MPPSYEDVIIQFANETIFKTAWLPRWQEWEINDGEKKYCQPLYWMPLPDAPSD